MSKQLIALMEKADIKGIAIKNGRMVERDYGHVYKGDLQEQWAVDKTSQHTQLRHWGTVLIEVTPDGCYHKNTLYAESKSDIDGINAFCQHYRIDLHAHYYPSKCEAHFHDNNDELIKIV